MKKLNEAIAVITGSSRGAGRGIALALADRGATVYVTGRTTRGAEAPDNLAGTVEDTAEEVTSRGGKGIAGVCDFTKDAGVAALAEQVGRDHGRIDILVLNAWGGYEGNMTGLAIKPFWQLPDAWNSMFERGVRLHLRAANALVPLMLDHPGGLIVTTIAWDRGKYGRNLYYDLSKQIARRMAYDMALELKPKHIASIALAPGFMRTERILEAHRRHPFDLGMTESPEYVGRAVAALASDPDVLTLTGGVFTSGELAQRYGFTDIDGRQPPPFKAPDEFYLD